MHKLYLVKVPLFLPRAMKPNSKYFSVTFLTFSRTQAILLYQTYACASLCYVALKFTLIKENVEIED